ncbi:NAD(P)H-dependent oxidoreductase [Fulvivirgaceae bacterium BMA10]|uniref:NAD(P)H-dependent oxidoreductase n=1 Tax=Splendidivirga corallicola TaxID=3051826 RepID=A0ABT8KMB9_9BACT|nr:NAD(P)H-dependent oxidoreductase [Fulvivirgaceae bacterium BMA10]
MENKSSVIILGSARSDGNTRKIVDKFIEENPGTTLVDLSTQQIEYFDYGFKNLDDDFIPLMEKILQHDLLIFATPVYWYSMSAVMKTFFDRITDLLYKRKELGRQLNGKYMMSISCGSDEELNDGFSIPFSSTANYLKMEYLGHLHTWLENDRISDEVLKRIQGFSNKLVSNT